MEDFDPVLFLSLRERGRVRAKNFQGFEGDGAVMNDS
jgi:hypothetical protein